MSVLRSMISHSIPSAAQGLRGLQRPMHELARRDDGDVGALAHDSATPNGTKCSPTGTSPLLAKSAFVSSMMTGSEPRSAVFIRPLASAGFDGMQTIRPGTCAHIGW